MHKFKSKATVVLGGQAGSEGKGKIAGYLAIKDNYAVSMCNFMTNAGHTWVSNDGERVMVQQLPQAVVNPDTILVITAGSAITISTLLNEIKNHNLGLSNRLLIHERAMIIEDRHVEEEAKSLGRISSTLKGCGHALADKAARGSAVMLAKDVQELSQWVVTDTGLSKDLYMALYNGLKVMIECPQGFDLDINHGLEYPYCTSRQTTSAQAIADAGLPPQAAGEIIAVIRPYPIRVGNVHDDNGRLTGYSGDYRGSKEITWEKIAKWSGTPQEEIKELTTVTKKLRRVFEPHWARLAEMVRINGVTQIALNFANYIDHGLYGKNKSTDITSEVQRWIETIESECGVPVTLVGTGPRDEDMIDLRTEKLK